MFIQDINQRGAKLDSDNLINSDVSEETKYQDGEINLSGHSYTSYPTKDYSEFRDKFSYYTSLLRKNKCQDVIIVFNYIATNWKKHGARMENENPLVVQMIHQRIGDLSRQLPEDDYNYDGDEFYDYYHAAIFENSLCNHKFIKPNGSIEQCMELKCDKVLNYIDIDPEYDPKRVRNRYCRGHNDYNHEKRLTKTRSRITECLKKLPDVLSELIGKYAIGDIVADYVNEKDKLTFRCALC
jgi:hypothetical protein